MARMPRYAKPLDSRWEVVETCDRFGRAVGASRPRVGARFGALVVVAAVETGKRARSRIRCDCGFEWDNENRELMRGRICCARCSWKQRSSDRRAANPDLDIIPDDCLRSRWIHRYTGVISRCYDPTHKAYPNYGGRGIRMCDEWLRDRGAFLRYAITLPHWDADDLDMDREDNNGHYEPGNIRLVSRSINTRNRRDNAFVTCRGDRITVAELHQRYCPGWRSYHAVAYHLNRGKSADEVVDYYERTRARVRPDGLRAEAPLHGAD